MPDSLGRDKKGENTRNSKGKCYMKNCPNKPAVTVTYFGKSVIVCRSHSHVDGVK
ncbi:hypothetical protein KNU49_gp034 [Streptomyces phage EGole]|uniref:Uncharacterized protein n=1 Tax=Streptomyces phage EGole TaxID=2517973 RepID=A0A482JH03_9CAUD|nr:hypothetical protein KNU49_gp034 [Streptomyces phage EGole]QBP30832.1 hypothetical protein SEA_EGOLE_34 [Streptomyces phage EGole]